MLLKSSEEVRRGQLCLFLSLLFLNQPLDAIYVFEISSPVDLVLRLAIACKSSHGAVADLCKQTGSAVFARMATRGGMRTKSCKEKTSRRATGCQTCRLAGVRQ